MVNYFFIAVSRGFACDSTGFLFHRHTVSPRTKVITISIGENHDDVVKPNIRNNY